MPWARVCGILNRLTSAGTTTMPPPIVKKPDTAPLATPIAGISRRGTSFAGGSGAPVLRRDGQPKYSASASRNSANA